MAYQPEALARAGHIPAWGGATGVFLPQPTRLQGLACGLALWQSNSRICCKGKMRKGLEIGNLIANGFGFWQCGHQLRAVLVLPLALRLGLLCHPASRLTI